MSKKIVLISFGVIIIISIIAVIIILTSQKSDNKGDVITKEETALKIGRALLEEYFPDYFINEDIPIEAEEENGIWRVNNYVEHFGTREDGTFWVSGGGGLFVKFRKDNGRVLMIGIDD